MSLLGWAIGLAALDEMEEGEQARREIKEKRWKLEEERRPPMRTGDHAGKILLLQRCVPPRHGIPSRPSWKPPDHIPH